MKVKPVVFNEINRQDTLCPWDDANDINKVIQIFKYPKDNPKFIDLTDKNLRDRCGFEEDFVSGRYIFVKFRLDEIEIKSPTKSKKYKVMYGPFWFDEDDFTERKLKAYMSYGNDEFFIFPLNEADYEYKLRNNSVEAINQHIHYNETDLNMIFVPDNEAPYVYFYIQFYKRQTQLYHNQLSNAIPIKQRAQLKMGKIAGTIDLSTGGYVRPPKDSVPTPINTSCGLKVPKGSS